MDFRKCAGHMVCCSWGFEGGRPTPLLADHGSAPGEALASPFGGCPLGAILWGSTAVDSWGRLVLGPCDHPGTLGSRVRVLGQNDARGRLLFPLPPNVPACADVWESRVPVIIDRFAEHYCRAHVWASIIVFAFLRHFGSRIKLVVLVRLSFPTHHPWAALGCPRKKGG